MQKYEGLAAAVDSSFCPAVIERYGLLDPGNGEIALPAVVLVSADKRVVWRYVGENPKDRPPEEQVLAELDRLQGR